MRHTFQQRNLIWPVHPTAQPRRLVFPPVCEHRKSNISILSPLTHQPWELGRFETGSAGLCLNSDIWGSNRLQWHPGGPMCLGWRLFVQGSSCIANSSRRTLQPSVAARSAGLLHLQRGEEPNQTSRGALWMKTLPNQRLTMHATDRCIGCFPYTQSAYSWQWITQKVSVFLHEPTFMFKINMWLFFCCFF